MNAVKRWLAFNWWYLRGRRPPWDTGVSPPELCAFIESHAPGRALDLGCGAGRDAVWLAAHGWRVTGVDLLPEAIGRARCLAERFGVSAATEWVVADLRRPERLPPGPCDLMLALLCRHWRLAIALADRLGPGGRLVLEAFGAGVRRPGVTATPKEVVQAAEAAGLRPELVDTGERRGAATVRAVLRRP